MLSEIICRHSYSLMQWVKGTNGGGGDDVKAGI